MNKLRLVSLLLIFVLLCTLISPGYARAQTSGDRDRIKQAIDRAVNYLLQKEKTKGVLSPWSYIALAAAWQSLDETRAGQACDKMLSALQSGEMNDYATAVLIILARGGNPYHYQGQNLIQKIKDAQLPGGKFADNVNSGGENLVNAHIWAVLALSAAGADIPDKEKALQWLIAQQHADGSFYWDATDRDTSDVDSTGMALMAMGAMGENKDSAPVKKAVAYIKTIQKDNGGFDAWGAENPETCNMVIEGLVAVGISPTGEELSKPNGNPVTAMLGFQLPDGSFEHLKGMGSNEMATQQALIALTDVYFGSTLFDRLKGKGKSILTFVDLQPSYWAYEAIRQLVEDRVLSGYPDNTFRPDNQVTRAEFAKYVVCGLNLGQSGTGKSSHFADVPEKHWADSVIKAAFAKGLMKGVSPERFAPDNSITGAEVITILVRAAGLENQAEMKKGDKWYSGYVEIASEKGLLYPGFDAAKPATRAQCAVTVAKIREMVKQ